jgi:hypothetical protein
LPAIVILYLPTSILGVLLLLHPSSGILFVLLLDLTLLLPLLFLDLPLLLALPLLLLPLLLLDLSLLLLLLCLPILDLALHCCSSGILLLLALWFALSRSFISFNGLPLLTIITCLHLIITSLLFLSIFSAASLVVAATLLCLYVYGSANYRKRC